MYKPKQKVKYIGGRYNTSSVFKKGDVGVIGDDLRIHWENGKKSLPMSKENSLIEIVEGEARIVSLQGRLF